MSKLTSAWTFAGVGAQQTAIAVNGILYASTSTGVLALDGDTGKEIWRYGAVPAPGGGGRGARGGRGGQTPPEGEPGDAAATRGAGTVPAVPGAAKRALLPRPAVRVAVAEPEAVALSRHVVLRIGRRRDTASPNPGDDRTALACSQCEYGSA